MDVELLFLSFRISKVSDLMFHSCSVVFKSARSFLRTHVLTCIAFSLVPPFNIVAVVAVIGKCFEVGFLDCCM